MMMMTWFSFKPRKFWRLLTQKLQHKLNRSKAGKKTKKRYHTTCKKLGWPSLSIQPNKFKNKPNRPHTTIRYKKRRHQSHKRPPPVFVDQLFAGPVSAVNEYVHPPAGGRRKEKSTSLEESGIEDLIRTGPAESSREDRSLPADQNMMGGPDDMWESMVLASPQMQGIDERADEFIARFRAEMNHQEMMARRL